MNQMTQGLDTRLDAEPPPVVRERIPTPFVWAPGLPTRLRVAVAGAGTRGKSSMLRTLRESGHSVTAYATAGALVYQLPSQPAWLDVIVLDCGAETDAIVPSLELLRAHSDAPVVAVVPDDEPSLLAEAIQLSIDQVLERPVHPVALLAALAAVSMPRMDELAVCGDTCTL